jgi:demethylmenaquinone methyltransferase/2-methoxy-6-polyprenyl-1,4-benzoquinol methylase
MLVHEGQAKARKFFTPANANSYDSVARLATFGQDYFWKREIIKSLGKHNPVLELACGTGILSSMMAAAGKYVTGIDLTFEYLWASRLKLHTAVVQGTAEMLPYRSESFGAVVSSYVAKYIDLQRAIDECWRVLKPGGIAVFHDFTYPNGFMSSLWSAYFVLLRVAGNVATSWKTVFNHLDDVIKNSDWVERATSFLSNRGFQYISCKYYTLGTAAIISAQKP